MFSPVPTPADASHDGLAEDAVRVASGGARVTGHVLVLFAFDVGRHVDLERASALLEGATRPRIIRGRRRAPAWFEYDPAPLHLIVAGDAHDIVGPHRTEPDVSIIVHDFGAAVVTYRLPMPGTMDELPGLAVALYDRADLEEDARARLSRITAALEPAIDRPRLAEAVEDYVIHCITGWSDPAGEGRVPGGAPATAPDTAPPTAAAPGAAPAASPEIARAFFERHRDTFARVIEAETTTLSPEQVQRSTQAAMGYAPGDLAVIDWNAAVLLDPEPDDVVLLLQHANVELLELRILDTELDRLVDDADESLVRILRRPLWPSFAERRMLAHVATAQSDAAFGFEGVHNAIKLVGTQYLARLYRVAAEQLGLPDWQASVERKLAAGEGLHARMSDATGTRRLEVLEWVIIILIAVSILLPFTPWY